MSTSPSRAQERPLEEWERIKRTFCDLYFKKNMTLPLVRDIIECVYGFIATYVLVIQQQFFQFPYLYQSALSPFQSCSATSS